MLDCRRPEGAASRITYCGKSCGLTRWGKMVFGKLPEVIGGKGDFAFAFSADEVAALEPPARGDSFGFP